MKKFFTLVFAVSMLCSCSMFDIMDPVFSAATTLYSGQTYKITRLSRNCNYEWISSDPDVLKVMVDPSDSTATIVCDLGGVALKSATEMSGPVDPKTVVLTAINKLHTEYTYEINITVKPWYLGFVNKEGKEVSSCKVGDELSIAMFDLATGSVIENIDDGHALSKNAALYLDFDKEEDHLRFDAVYPFKADVTAVKAATLHMVTATLVNGCQYDSDRTMTASISISE